jgi:anti-sigma factor RsiW
MKHECGDIRRLLDAWVDGELSSSDGRRVARHLEGCPGCREDVESRRGFDAALRADNQSGDPGDAYFEILKDRIDTRFDFAEASRHWAKPAEPPRARRLMIPRAWVPRFAFGIAGAAVATIAGLLVHDLGRQRILAPLPRVTDAVTERQEQTAPAEPPRASTGTTRPRQAAVPPGHLAEPAMDRRQLKVQTNPGPMDFSEAKSGKGGASEGAAYPISADESAEPDRPALLAFFGALAEAEEGGATRPSTEAASAPTRWWLGTGTHLAVSSQVDDHRDKTVTTADSVATHRLQDEANPPADSTWIRLRRDEARALADSALATGSLEDCESALRAYWAMLHRGGRPVLPVRVARARILEPDRLRISALLRCASR